VDCVSFLSSSWNVLLRVGEQFQAFHRTTLVEYMRAHTTYHPYLEHLFDTPHKQTVLQSVTVWLNWSDYSIVELVPAYTLTIGNQTKSIFNCLFYTVEQWANRHVGFTISAPPQHEIPELPPSAPDLPLHHPDVYWMDG